LQMPGQPAARRMGFRFGMSISNGGLAHRSWARTASGKGLCVRGISR
jgi:hypothetical protein